MRCTRLLLMVLPFSCFASERVECVDDPVRAEGSYQFAERAARQYDLPDLATVRKVYITSLPVFDEDNPRESNIVYRWGNRIHVETSPELIRKQLLFNEGESLDLRLLDESERILRQQKYLYDADIRPLSVCDDQVDLEVISRDVWSLSVDLSFDRSGGENNYGIGLRDTNLLGTGTELSIKTKQDIDRDSTELAYKNNNVRGSRIKSRLRYSDNDDGSEEFGLLELPFYSLDARRAWTVSLRNTDQIDTQYLRGDDVTEVRHEFEDYRVSHGFSKGLRDGNVHRWALGYWYRSSQFSNGDELPPPAEFPEDRDLSFPYLEYSFLEDEYVERVNITQFERTEDLYVGRSFYTRFGYSSESFGGDLDRLVYEGLYRNTLFYDQNHFLLHDFEFVGLYNLEEDKSEDVVMDYALRYIFSKDRYRSYLASLRATYTINLNSNQQVFIGGDTGLRAFDNRFQVGDRSIVLNVERRRFTDIHLFNLIRVGWAVFFDVGRAWDPDVDDDFEDDYLANIGIGLRLASSKSDVGRFMHVDLAFPLTNRDDPDVDSSEISVRLTNRF